MKKLDIKQVPKLRPDPLFKDMPRQLKDPKNFVAIEKRLIKILRTKHKHKTAKAYVACVLCNSQRLERQKMMREEGFTSIQQYLGWKRIMTIINDKKSFQVR